MENGPFKSRDDLKKVKSIGDKTFTQCAGFIRIEPLTANVTKYNLLDSTWVHPESYHIAEKIMKNLGLAAKEIGTSRFIAKIKEFSSKGDSALSTLAKEFKVPTERVSIFKFRIFHNQTILRQIPYFELRLLINHVK